MNLLSQYESERDESVFDYLSLLIMWHYIKANQMLEKL